MKTTVPKLTRQQKAEGLGEVIKFIPGDKIGMRAWGTFPTGTKAGRKSMWVVGRVISDRGCLHFRNSIPRRASEAACKIVIYHLSKPGCAL